MELLLAQANTGNYHVFMNAVNHHCMHSLYRLHILCHYQPTNEMWVQQSAICFAGRRYRMETPSPFLVICVGNTPVTSGFPPVFFSFTKGEYCGALVFPDQDVKQLGKMPVILDAIMLCSIDITVMACWWSRLVRLVGESKSNAIHWTRQCLFTNSPKRNCFNCIRYQCLIWCLSYFSNMCFRAYTVSRTWTRYIVSLHHISYAVFHTSLAIYELDELT